MGDRTNIALRVHPDDINNPDWQEFVEDWGPGEFVDDPPWEWSTPEMNYAGYDELTHLAAYGVRFEGNHGPGGCYEAQEFFHDGSGIVEYSPIDTWSHNRIVVDVDGDGNIITSIAIERCKELDRYNRICREIDEAIQKVQQKEDEHESRD